MTNNNNSPSCSVGLHVLDSDSFGLDYKISRMMVDYGYDCDHNFDMVPLFKEYLVVMVDDGGWTLDDIDDIDTLEGLWEDYNHMVEHYRAGESFRTFLNRELIEPCRALDARRGGSRQVT